MKKFPILALLLCLHGPSVQAQMKSQYTPYELDILEAHLNKQWKRVEEVSNSFARFMIIRQDVILNGYQKDVDTWYKDVDSWMKTWNGILDKMESPSLVDEQVQRDVIQDLKNQLMVLETILQRYQEVQAKGTEAMSALNALPTYPTNYIDVDENSSTDTYSIQIEKYLEQIADAKSSLSKAQTALLNAGTQRFTAIGKSLEGALLFKIKSVLLDSPVLAEALREAQSALDQMRTVDIVLARLEKERVEVAREISGAGIFQARKHLASWKAKGDATVLGITSNPQVNTTMQDYARRMWDIKVKGLEELLKNMVQGRSDVLIFAGFYNDALYGSFGMVDQCRTTRPRTIDCNLLRTVQGFKRSQLMRLKPDQAAYIESLILKAKQGVMRPKN